MELKLGDVQTTALIPLAVKANDFEKMQGLKTEKLLKLSKH